MYEYIREYWVYSAVGVGVCLLLLALWIWYRKWLWENIFGIAFLNCLAFSIPSVRVGLITAIDAFIVKDFALRNESPAWQVTVAAMALHFLTVNRERILVFAASSPSPPGKKHVPSLGIISKTPATPQFEDLDSMVSRAERIQYRRRFVRLASWCTLCFSVFAAAMMIGDRFVSFAVGAIVAWCLSNVLRPSTVSSERRVWYYFSQKQVPTVEGRLSAPKPNEESGDAIDSEFVVTGEDRAREVPVRTEPESESDTFDLSKLSDEDLDRVRALLRVWRGNLSQFAVEESLPSIKDFDLPHREYYIKRRDNDAEFRRVDEVDSLSHSDDITIGGVTIWARPRRS